MIYDIPSQAINICLGSSKSNLTCARLGGWVLDGPTRYKVNCANFEHSAGLTECRLGNWKIIYTEATDCKVSTDPETTPKS